MDKEDMVDTTGITYQRKANLKWLRKRGINGFTEVIKTTSLYDGVMNLINLGGVGPIKTNVVALNFHEKWMVRSSE